MSLQVFCVFKYLCCSWVTHFYNPKSFQVVSEFACPIPLLPCFPLWGFGLGDGVDNHSFSPFPWCVLRESSFICQLFCGGISSVTGASAFNELNQRCLCFACSFRAGSLWADESWWGQTGFTPSVPFKKRKTHSICSICSLKNQHFPEFNAKLENKTFWKALSAVRCSPMSLIMHEMGGDGVCSLTTLLWFGE